MSDTHETAAECAELVARIDSAITSLEDRTRGTADRETMRRCDADRRRLQRHMPVEGGWYFEGKDVRICGHCSPSFEHSATYAPCDDLLDLAYSHSLERDDWFIE